ncbi:MAG TPA: hypothetical protein VHB25_07080 [Gemmatimonadaceae bacterium]|nr:hypothetical protein [Gemmatimonadaceae bacterium]
MASFSSRVRTNCLAPTPEHVLSLPANTTPPTGDSLIAGSVLPIQRAEELLATLPGVISARIVAGQNGAVEEIHILTTTDVTPKQTVRNVESALIAHLGMRVSHKKISVATSDEGQRPVRTSGALHLPTAGPTLAATPPVPLAAIPGPSAMGARRRLYFEDVEVRRSRTKGVACRVTLKKGDQSYVGESEGLENERLRIELAARATLSAIRQAEGEERVLALEGCKLIEAFDREFVFVGVTTRSGRDTSLMTGSAEVRESPETASVLAVLDATNRWLEK